MKLARNVTVLVRRRGKAQPPAAPAVAAGRFATSRDSSALPVLARRVRARATSSPILARSAKAKAAYSASELWTQRFLPELKMERASVSQARVKSASSVDLPEI